MMKTYAQAEAFLNGFINYEKLLGGPVVYDTKAFDLENFRELLHRIGDPHLKYSAIHVAGTKGKGSTCLFLAEVLRAAGYRVGLYMSPHIGTYLERISINGGEIPEVEFCEILSRLAETAGTNAANFRTVFELLTATAFVWFAQQGVDIAIIETGLGGRLDATNVFDRIPDNPNGFLATVITPIAYDHTAILGDTIEKIASEKAGILRPHAITVLAQQPAEWSEIVRKVMTGRLDTIAHAGPIYQADEWASIESEAGRCAVLRLPKSVPEFAARPNAPLVKALRCGIDVSPRMPGRHQVQNLATASATLCALQYKGYVHAVDARALQTGASVAWRPGRCEIVSRNPLVIVDGAHCKLSSAALGSTVRDQLAVAAARVIVVCGFMRDKDIAGMCSALLGELRVEQFVSCTPPGARAAAAEDAARMVGEVASCPVVAIPELKHAVKYAAENIPENGALVVFGSMFLVGPAREALKRMQA